MRPDEIEYILLTIRWMESRETYDIPPNKGGASGAYQYIKKTWANYAGYPEAYLAPPWVQDERAAADVAAILRRYNNDVSVVPIIWYYPAALTNPALMDIVPKPEAGNVLTIREYQWRWLDTLAYFMGGPLPPRLYALPPGLELLSGIPPVVPAAAAADQVSLAFPLLGPAAVAPPPPCDGEACDDPNPAIVYGRKLQPVLAAADGVVTSVVYEDASTGRVELTITDTAGTSYHYAGFNDDNPGTDDGAAPPALRLTALARVGGAVRAGQVIGFLGDSDREPINTTVAPATDISRRDHAATDPASDPASDPRDGTGERTGLAAPPAHDHRPRRHADRRRRTRRPGVVPPDVHGRDRTMVGAPQPRRVRRADRRHPGRCRRPRRELDDHRLRTGAGHRARRPGLPDARLPVVAARSVRPVRRRQHRAAARLHRSHRVVGRDLDRDHARRRGCPPRRVAAAARTVITGS